METSKPTNQLCTIVISLAVVASRQQHKWLEEWETKFSFLIYRFRLRAGPGRAEEAEELRSECGHGGSQTSRCEGAREWKPFTFIFLVEEEVATVYPLTTAPQQCCRTLHTAGKTLKKEKVFCYCCFFWQTYLFAYIFCDDDFSSLPKASRSHSQPINESIHQPTIFHQMWNGNEFKEMYRCKEDVE